MPADLTPWSPPDAPAAVTTLDAQARTYLAHAKARNTLRAYRTDWADFTTWCDEQSLPALPATPETVARYLTARAGTVRVSTLQRRLSAINQAHAAKGYPPISLRAEPLRSVWAGIRRVHGVAQRGKAPVVTAALRAMVRQLPDSLIGLRDRALLLLGFAGAFRRSELVALTVADLAFHGDGLTVTLRRSKTDQAGAGRQVGIPYGSHRETCPVRAVQAWLAAAGISEGPVFRGITRHGQVQPAALSDKAVALIVKRWAAAAGLDPAQYAGHSLRAGLATAAAQAGVPERVIMAQTGHRSVTMVRRYIRTGSLFRENAAAEVGL
jgi:integrase